MCKYRRHLAYRRWSMTLAAGLLALNSAAAEPLRVVVSGSQSPGATLFLALYQNSDEGWRRAPVATEQLVLPDEGQAELTVTLPPGRYAMRAFADLNNNAELDMRRRKPAEPFAISVGDGRSEPSVKFSQAVFSLGQAGADVELRLIYPADLERD